jgi:hypothetical protein
MLRIGEAVRTTPLRAHMQTQAGRAWRAATDPNEEDQGHETSAADLCGAGQRDDVGRAHFSCDASCQTSVLHRQISAWAPRAP